MPSVPTLPVFSTGAAAEMASNNPNIGAIASSLAIKTHQLQVAVKGIEDYRGNTTRFLVIGIKSPEYSGADRTSLLIGTMDRPGALNEILTVLSKAEINLAKIELGVLDPGDNAFVESGVPDGLRDQDVAPLGEFDLR